MREAKLDRTEKKPNFKLFVILNSPEILNAGKVVMSFVTTK